MTAFHEVQFPPDISYGAQGGPKRLTQVVTLKSGFEQRNQSWLHSRRNYNAGLGLTGPLKMQYLYATIKFWEARAGRLYGFRWKDWADFKSGDPTQQTTNVDQAIGVGNASNQDFQLIKTYADSGGSYTRLIKKPVAGTLKVALNGANQASGWTINTTTGILHFTSAPGNGVAVTAGFEFDVPARFDDDELTISIDAFQAGSVPTIKVVEIRV